ncbi:MAG: GIY-YIG nuclease family protein [candidate division WOR-3 bacterium]|nr:MAG: GIY-YIG nuclease family protein [candidate division WOR-3 bacterium]
MKNGDLNLANLVILLMDCQTTGANPKRGSVLEIGWARSDSLDYRREMSEIKVRLFRKPIDFKIPARVQKLTGIEMDDVLNGVTPEDIWGEILATADTIARLNDAQTCPTVIHFAKFEIPFLIDLHGKFGERRDFPFTFICTHEIARYLFPDLPRRSLRAMAGFLGHSLPLSRRCREHVHATGLIWGEIVRVLEEKYGIVTYQQLMQWLQQPKVLVPSSRSYPMSSCTLQDLPAKPGVYRMLRSNGDVLYVGKAKSLKSRVKSYFRKSTRHPEHILEMLTQAKDLDLTTTESLLEASLLESDEIKRLAPPYNIALRQGEREICFFSNDLSEFNSLPTEKHRIGPIACREAILSFAAVGKIIGSDNITGVDEELLMRGICVSDTFVLDSRCVRSGYQKFMEKYAGALRNGSPTECLHAVASQLWIESKEERLCENDGMQELVLKSIEIPAWTSDSVCRLIESTVMHAGHAIRRARWFATLTESSVGWAESPDSDGSYFLIVFEKGQILYRRTFNRGELPVPPGYWRGFVDRHRSFDVMTYDRMRVVTTELSKVMAADGWVQIRFSPDNVLGGEQLINLMHWL